MFILLRGISENHSTTFFHHSLQGDRKNVEPVNFGSDNEGYETQIVVQCSKDTLHTIQHDPRPGPTYFTRL